MSGSGNDVASSGDEGVEPDTAPPSPGRVCETSGGARTRRCLPRHPFRMLLAVLTCLSWSAVAWDIGLFSPLAGEPHLLTSPWVARITFPLAVLCLCVIEGWLALLLWRWIDHAVDRVVARHRPPAGTPGHTGQSCDDAEQALRPPAADPAPAVPMSLPQVVGSRPSGVLALRWARSALGVLLVLGMPVLMAAELLAGFVVTAFSQADWQLVTTATGERVWRECAYDPDDCVAHHPRGPFLVDAEGHAFEPEPGGAPVPMDPVPADPAPESSPSPADPTTTTGDDGAAAGNDGGSSDEEAHTARVVPVDSEEVVVRDRSGSLGLTAGPVSAVSRGADGRWVRIGEVTSSGEPLGLWCADAECVAGTGSASGGGEVWTTTDGGVTWRDVTPEAPSGDRTFLRSATHTSSGWQVCLGYPEWTDPEGTDNVCGPLAATR